MASADLLADYTFIRKIGQGSYGEVWLSKHKVDKKKYVLKKISLSNANKKERHSAEQECKLLSQLRHPNIVAYKDSFEHDTILYIAMAYCEGGDLYSKLKEQRGAPLQERQIVEWFVQIAMALQYMHERNILHRDLKTQNVFLTRSKIIKVGDLGIARVLDSSNDMAKTLIGTPYYMSPELFSNKPYNHKSDVWALGCCVYEMATLKHAFNARDFSSLSYKILKGRMPDMPMQYSSELLQLIRNMLNTDPDKRWSVNKILRDSFIRRNIQIFLEGTKRPPSAPVSRPIIPQPQPRSKPAEINPPVPSSSSESPEVATPRSSLNSAARRRRREQMAQNSPAFRHSEELSNIKNIVLVQRQRRRPRSANAQAFSPQQSPLLPRAQSEMEDKTDAAPRNSSNAPRESSANSGKGSGESSSEMQELVARMNETLKASPRKPTKDAQDGSQKRPPSGSSSGDDDELPGPIESKEETLGRTNLMRDRLVQLRKDCMRALGVDKLREAYHILDSQLESDEIEVRLKEVLGNELFDGYAGKIWQLKFVEERLF